MTHDATRVFAAAIYIIFAAAMIYRFRDARSLTMGRDFSLAGAFLQSRKIGSPPVLRTLLSSCTTAGVATCIP